MTSRQPAVPARWSAALAWAAAVLSLGGCGPDPQALPESQVPSRFLRVHGSADASLTMQASVRYFTAAEHCRRAPSRLRRLDGQMAPRMQQVMVAVTRAADSRYEAWVPLDQFAPGECGWHPFMIAFQVQGPQGSSTGEVKVDYSGRARLEPGAQGVVWVDSAIRRAHLPAQDFPRGAREIAPIELLCRDNVIRGVTTLSCVTPRPGQLAVIAEDAKDVEVNFRDLTRAGDGF